MLFNSRGLQRRRPESESGAITGVAIDTPDPTPNEPYENSREAHTRCERLNPWDPNGSLRVPDPATLDLKA